VNPEYEAVRPDGDGDGLSDQWEEINGRDPADGRLLFEFDCGGWQTEGWQPDGIQSNIAGYQGYLDFSLGRGGGAIERKGLDVEATRNDRSLVISVRSSEDLHVQVSANGRKLGAEQKVTAGESFTSLRLSLANEPAWKGTIASLKLNFRAEKEALIEIDFISVERDEG
jgi:hypothetical protein